MFCIQEPDRSLSSPLMTTEQDPLCSTQSESSDDEPTSKSLKYANTDLNLQVYQIPYSPPNTTITIYPSSTSSLPKFVNNPLNLANPLAFATSNMNTSIAKTLHSRYSLPAKLTITPVSKITDGEIVRYKKNGEIAKKRGPPKGYKRKPKDLSHSFSNGALLQVCIFFY